MALWKVDVDQFKGKHNKQGAPQRLQREHFLTDERRHLHDLRIQSSRPFMLWGQSNNLPLTPAFFTLFASLTCILKSKVKTFDVFVLRHTTKTFLFHVPLSRDYSHNNAHK